MEIAISKGTEILSLAMQGSLRKFVHVCVQLNKPIRQSCPQQMM